MVPEHAAILPHVWTDARDRRGASVRRLRVRGRHPVNIHKATQFRSITVSRFTFVLISFFFIPFQFLEESGRLRGRRRGGHGDRDRQDDGGCALAHRRHY